MYQRGIYPPESFSRVTKYGLAMLVTSDDSLKAYLDGVLGQVTGARSIRRCERRTSGGAGLGASVTRAVVTSIAPWLRADWLSKGNVQKLVVVVCSQQSGETLERWVFDVQTDKETPTPNTPPPPPQHPPLHQAIGIGPNRPPHAPTRAHTRSRRRQWLHPRHVRIQKATLLASLPTAAASPCLAVAERPPRRPSLCRV